MKITAISDTHNKHRHAHNILPKADILIHAGDACGEGSRIELQIFAAWLDMLPYRHKIYVAGNHDKYLQDNPSDARSILSGVKGLIYLQDSSCNIDGVKFYGSPCIPPIRHWAWGCPDEQRAKIFSRVPVDTDILITHTPAYGCGDLTLSNTRIGCQYLRNVIDRVKPKYHVFGHVHESAGVGSNGTTTFINAAFLNRKYNPANRPVVFDI